MTYVPSTRTAAQREADRQEDIRWREAHRPVSDMYDPAPSVEYRDKTPLCASAH